MLSPDRELFGQRDKRNTGNFWRRERWPSKCEEVKLLQHIRVHATRLLSLTTSYNIETLCSSIFGAYLLVISVRRWLVAGSREVRDSSKAIQPCHSVWVVCIAGATPAL